MSQNNASLTIGVAANTKDFENDMQRAAKTAERAAAMIKKSISQELEAARKKAQMEANGIKQVMSGLGGLAAGYFSIEGVKSAVEMADKMKTLEARIKNATKATGDFKTVNEELFSISQRNGAAFEDSVSVFQSLARSSKELGATNADMLKLTDTVQKLGAIGGSSTEAMKNGLLQFSQAMAGGTVHAEEFNSILENMPEVANRIAGGLGMTVGHMRQLVADGKITSKEVFDALLKQSDQINKDFEKMPVSLGQAGQMVQNSFGKFFEQLDKSVGITGSLAQGFQGISKTVDGITKAIKGWSEAKVNFEGVNTTQGTAWKAQFEHTNDAIWKGFGNAGQATWDAISNPQQYMKNAAAGKYKSIWDLNEDKKDLKKRTADLESQRPKDQYGPFLPEGYNTKTGETKEQQKAREKREKELAKQNENFQEYLKNLKQETIELSLQNKHLDAQHAIVKALYDAEQKKGAALTDNEKKLVTQAALEKEKAEKAKEAAKKAAEQKKDYEKISAELIAQGKGLDLVNAGQEGAAHWAEKRYEIEQKIKEAGLTEDQAKKLRAQNEENILKEQEAEHQKILKSTQDQREEAELIFQGREKELPLIQKIREEEEKGILTAERRQQIEQTFWDTKRAEAFKAFNDISAKEGDEINKSLLKLKGQEDYIPLLEKENEIKKMIGVSDEQKAEMIDSLRQQNAVQLGLNNALEQQKRTVDSIMKGNDGYVNQVRKLSEALGSGQINVKQYNDAMAQLAANGKKASEFATDFAKTITGGLDKAITKGEKLGNVFKDMGKQLASLALQKVTPMLANGIDNILGRLSGGFGGLFSKPAGVPGAGGIAGGGLDNYAQDNWLNLQQIAYNTSFLPKLQPRAAGGSTWGGQPYLVGERGPELFMPSTDGMIMPNNWQPSYSDKAMALSRIAEQRAQDAQDQGLWLQASLYRQNILGGSKAWAAWASMNPGFGNTPQIANDANDFRGFLDRDPRLRGMLDQRLVGWADRVSGGIGRNSYSFLQGAQSYGWGGSAGDMAQNPMMDGMQDFSIGGMAALKSRMAADAYFANPNRATAFNRPWFGNEKARFLPLDQVAKFVQEYQTTIGSSLGLALGSMIAGDGFLSPLASVGKTLTGTTNADLMAALMGRGGGKAPANWSAPMPAYMPDGITRDGFSSYGDNLKRAYGFGAVERPDMPFWEKPMSQLEYRIFYGKQAAKAAYYRPTFDYGYQLQNQPGSWSDSGMTSGWWKAMPRYAAGGRFDGSRPIVVGENGAEVIVPTAAGNVIPNHKLDGFGRPELKVIVNNQVPGVDVDVTQDINGNTIATIRKMLNDQKKQMAAEFGLTRKAFARG